MLLTKCTNTHTNTPLRHAPFVENMPEFIARYMLASLNPFWIGRVPSAESRMPGVHVFRLDYIVMCKHHFINIVWYVYYNAVHSEWALNGRCVLLCCGRGRTVRRRQIAIAGNCVKPFNAAVFGDGGGSGAMTQYQTVSIQIVCTAHLSRPVTLSHRLMFPLTPYISDLWIRYKQPRILTLLCTV